MKNSILCAVLLLFVSKMASAGCIDLKQTAEQEIKLNVSAREKKCSLAALYLELRYCDHPGKIIIKINDKGTVPPPASCIAIRDSIPGMVAVPVEWLKEGENSIVFAKGTVDADVNKREVLIDKALLLFAASEAELNKKFRAEMLSLKTPVETNHYARRITRGTDYSRPVSVRHRFYDDFEKHKCGTDFPYWIAQTGEWLVTNVDGNQVMALNKPLSSARLMLYAFGQNTDFSGKVKVTSASGDDGGVYLISRCSFYPNWMVRAGYNFAESRWEIIENYNSSTLVDYRKGSLSRGQWHDFRMVMSGNKARLYCDGKEVITSELFTNSNYGKVGIELCNLTAQFDNLNLVGEGVPLDGVYFHSFKGIKREGYAGSADIVALKDGRWLLRMFGTEYPCYISTDKGATWIPQEKDPLNTAFSVIGIERLKDGRLLSIERRPNTAKPPSNLFAKTSPDEGRTWSEWHQISSGLPLSAMNGKICVGDSGNIYLPAGMSRGYMTERYWGGVFVFRSSDGVKWERSEELSLASKGVNLQEGSIAELNDGRLMMVMRTTLGYLVASYSSDKGITWGQPQRLPLASTLNAFGFKKADDGELFIFWTYDDTTQCPEVPQFPRERLCLASSSDSGKTWKFLGDIADFGGNNVRFMNQGLRIIDDKIFMTSTIFEYDGKGGRAVGVWIADRNKLKAYPEFPPLH